MCFAGLGRCIFAPGDGLVGLVGMEGEMDGLVLGGRA